MQESQVPEEIIVIVDDDPSVREGLRSLIRSAGLRVEAFASAQEFLARTGAKTPSCLVLDLQLPGLSGLDLQKPDWPWQHPSLRTGDESRSR